MMKMKVSGANCRVVMRKHLGGSVLKGTVFNRWEGISTYLKIESGEPAEKLAHLLKNAKAGCFAEGLITQQVTLHSHMEVNGRPFKIEVITATKHAINEAGLSAEYQIARSTRGKNRCSSAPRRPRNTVTAIQMPVFSYFGSSR